MSEAATSVVANSPVAPPGVVSTPVIPSPEASPGKLHARQIPNSTNTTVKTYGSSTPRRTGAKLVAPPAPVAPAAVEAAPAATEAPAAEVASEAAPEAAAEPLVTLEGATDAPAAAEAAPEPEPAKTISNADYAKRLARIANAEGRLASEKQKFSEEQSKHRERIARVEQIEKATETVHADPVGFLARMWGVKPQTIVDQLIRINKGEQPTPAAPQVAAKSATDEKIEALEKQLKDAAEERKAQKAQSDVSNYIALTVVPLVSDKTQFPFLNHKLGADAAEHVYKTMEANWKRAVKTNPNARPPEPLAVAQFIEKHFRDEAAQDAALLGGRAAPEQPQANPKKVTTPQATPKPVAAQSTPAVASRKARLTSRSYSVTPK